LSRGRPKNRVKHISSLSSLNTTKNPILWQVHTEAAIFLKLLEADCGKYINEADNVPERKRQLVERMEDKLGISPKKSMPMLDLLGLLLRGDTSRLAKTPDELRLEEEARIKAEAEAKAKADSEAKAEAKRRAEAAAQAAARQKQSPLPSSLPLNIYHSQR